MPELRSSVAGSSFIKACPPFTIILQKTPGKACCLEIGVLNACISPEGLKRSGPFDYSEQSVQIEPLPSCRVGKVDATNGGLKPLATCPSILLDIPHKVFREFNIVVLLSIRVFGIGLKVAHELGLGVLSTLQYVFSLPSGVKDNSLLIRQVNWKRDQSRMLGVNLIPSQPPTGLRCTDIACTEILLDLILVLPKLHSSPIMALVDVLVDVLD